MMNTLLDFIEFSLSGLAVGGIYALTAVGFVIVYKATRIINFAIGELMMLGAYMFFGLATQAMLPMWAAVLLALLATGVAGAFLERTIFRPLIGENPISVFMVTIGLASIIIGIVEIVWTADPRSLPVFLPDQPFFVPLGFGEAGHCDARHARHTEQSRGLNATMPGDDPSALINENRVGKSELTHRCRELLPQPRALARVLLIIH